MHRLITIIRVISTKFTMRFLLLIYQSSKCFNNDISYQMKIIILDETPVGDMHGVPKL